MKGGKRAGAGRKPGSTNKLKDFEREEVKSLALQHAPAAIERLAVLAQKAQSEAASVAACNSILDRAYGKAPQAVAVTGGEEGDQPVRIEFGWAASSAS